jgi:hypothetical protein
MSNPDLPSVSTGRLALIFTAPTIPEGLLVKGLFEANDIPVFTKGEIDGPYRIGPVFLYVPEAFEVHAKLLLAEVEGEARSAQEGASSEGHAVEETEPGLG